MPVPSAQLPAKQCQELAPLQLSFPLFEASAAQRRYLVTQLRQHLHQLRRQLIPGATFPTAAAPHRVNDRNWSWPQHS